MTIQKGVPIPARSRLLEAMKSMRMQDSIAIHENQTSDCYKYSKRLKIKIEIHKLDGIGWRLWRIK